MDIRAGTLQKTVKFTVDTGASVSVLPKCIVEEYFEGVPLQPPAARHVTARLLCFNYDVVYRAGTQNQTANCLSRLPLTTDPAYEPENAPELVALLSTAQAAITPSEFKSASASCGISALLFKKDGLLLKNL